MKTSEKMKAVANTLETLDIKASGENVSKMTAVYQMMNDIIREITGMESVTKEEAGNDAAGEGV